MFIDGFAKIASPLTKLLKKEIPFHWNATQEKCFTDLKSGLIDVERSGSLGMEGDEMGVGM